MWDHPKLLQPGRLLMAWRQSPPRVRGFAVAGAVGILVGLGVVVAADERPAGETSGARKAPAATAGMRVYTDPATGAVVPQAPPGAVPPASARSVSAVQQSAGTSAGGGVKATGDFRMSMGTRIDASGKVVTDCVPAAGRKE
jgi:hypothetical protein